MKINFVLFISALLSLTAFAQDSGTMDGYIKCMEDHKVFRKFPAKKDYLQHNGNSEFKNTSYTFKISFGEKFSQIFSDKKITDICLNSEYQKNYTEIFACMNNFTYQNYTRTQISIAKEYLYDFCTENFKQKDNVAKVSGCIKNIETKLKFTRSSNKFQYIFTSDGLSNNLVEYCKDPKNQSYLENLNREEQESCYSKKLDIGHFNNDIVIPKEFVEYVMNSLNQNQPLALKIKNINSKNKAKGEQEEIRTTLSEYFEAIRDRTHHFGMAMTVMKSCSDEEIVGRKLYEFYNNPKFIKCLETMDKSMSVKTREGICAPLTEFEEIEQVSGISKDQTSSAAKVNDNDPTIDSIGDFWDWLWNEGKFDTSGAVKN